jgi:hypothetical protein
MLRALGGTGVPVPRVEGEHENILLLEYVPNDSIFNMPAWADVGRTLRASTTSRARATAGLSTFGSERSSSTIAKRRIGPPFGASSAWCHGAPSDRPWRERSSGWLVEWLSCFPSRPSRRSSTVIFGAAIFSFRRGSRCLDRSCLLSRPRRGRPCHADSVRRASAAFWDSYGRLEPGWEDRRPVYQLFPALVHLRLFGANYSSMVDRLLTRIGT